jgi:TRAP-type C4-dicarboxylate transport system permease small subunit
MGAFLRSEMLLKTAKFVENILFYIMSGLLGIIAVLLMTLVILRYFFGIGIFGGNDFSKILFVYTTALGAAALTSSKGHIAIDFFIMKLPLKIRQIIEVIKYLLIAGMFVLIVYHSTNWILKTGTFKIDSLDIPQWISQISMVIGGILGIFYSCLSIFTSSHLEQLKSEEQ